MNSVEEVLQELFKLIIQHKAPYVDYRKLFSEKIATINVMILNFDDSWTLLTTLLDLAASEASKESSDNLLIAGKLILQHWERHDKHHTLIATQTYIWSYHNIIYLPYLQQITCSIDQHYVYLYIALAQNSKSLCSNFLYSVPALLETWHSAYKLQKSNYLTIKKILSEIQEHVENTEDSQVILTFIQEYCDYVAPTYLFTSQIDKDEVQQAIENQVTVPPVQRILDALPIDHVEKSEIVKLQATYKILSLMEKADLLQVLDVKYDEKNISEDILLCQYYGINNSLEVCPRSTLEGLSCRMFTCFCVDDRTGYFTNTGEPTWFTGKCDSCASKIACIRHAVRIPLLTKGWEGCYCSIECATKNLQNITEIYMMKVVIKYLNLYKVIDC